MGIILLVLLLALILGGLGSAIHILWWIALVVLVKLVMRWPSQACSRYPGVAVKTVQLTI
jgi:hypothetical protein